MSMADEKSRASGKLLVTDAAAAHGRPKTRITLTFPAIDASRHIAFLVGGEGKRAILQEVLAGGGTKPAARLSPVGDILFIAHRAAAGG
jgi:6-phosphogluconolactonase